MGIYCGCGDWDRAADMEWRGGEDDDDEKYVSSDCGCVKNVEWWVGEGVKREYGDCIDDEDVEAWYVAVDCGGIECIEWRSRGNDVAIRELLVSWDWLVGGWNL